MSVSTVDAPLLRHTNDALARPLPPLIRDARTDLSAIVADMLAIPESALERHWAWIGGGEGDVRYGVYRPHELFERAEIEASRQLRTSGRDGGMAAAIIGPATDIELDAAPRGGEWTIRLTMGHTVNSQRAYGWSTAWWQERGFALDDPALPPRVSEELFAALPDEETAEAAGSLDDIRERLDEILDLSAERLAGIADDRLRHGARWSGSAWAAGRATFASTRSRSRRPSSCSAACQRSRSDLLVSRSRPMVGRRPWCSVSPTPTPPRTSSGRQLARLATPLLTPAARPRRDSG